MHPISRVPPLLLIPLTALVMLSLPACTDTDPCGGTCEPASSCNAATGHCTPPPGPSGDGGIPPDKDDAGSDGGTDGGSDGGTDGGSCTPAKCPQLGKNCGLVSDGCEGILDCGSCSNGQNCGGSGIPNVCGTAPCTPKTCTQLGKNCGSVPDTCGTLLQCGTCSAPNTCGGGGQPNVCGCTSESDADFCSRLGKNCGYVSGTDNCGRSRTSVNCGTCTSPETCGGAGTLNVCGVCTPKTCDQLGKNCGSVFDGCGGTLDCGTCSGGLACNSSNICVACTDAGSSCGSGNVCCGGTTCGYQYGATCNRLCCVPNGGACTQDLDCCGTQCQTNPAGCSAACPPRCVNSKCCTPRFYACRTASDCCSGICTQGTCG